MAEDTKPSVGGAAVAEGQTPRSIQIASRGIRTADDAANMLSALIGDVATDSVSVKKANSICNVTGKLLKVVDMQQRFGKPENGEPKTLQLADPDDANRATLEAEKARLRSRLAELEASGKVV